MTRFLQFRRGIFVAANNASALPAGYEHAAHSTAITPGEVPEWVHLIPIGAFTGRDGRGPWHLTDAAAVIATTLDYHDGQPAPIDYDHQLELTEKNGGTAPASGWITALEARADGIWGKVDWTPAAQAKLRAKEYRYLSPVFAYAKNGEILALLRAGLTNKPNLALTAINATSSEEAHMTQMSVAARQRLAALLKLPSTADDDAIIAGANSIVESEQIHRAGLTVLRGTLKLGETAGADEILVAAQAMGGALSGAPCCAACSAPLIPKCCPDCGAPTGNAVCAASAVASAVTDPSKFVPIAAHSAVMAELATMRTAESVRVVDAAVADGKIIPANRDWAIAYHAKDALGFADFIGKQAKVVYAGVERRDITTGRAQGTLTTADKAVCAAMNIAEDDFIKNIDKES